MDEMSTPTPEDAAYCFSQINAISCSTGVAQGFIDADLSCGRDRLRGIEEIRKQANGCAMSEGGKFCASAFTLFDLNGIGQSNIERNCSGVIASNFCPSACRTLLEDFRSRLGCCINAHINGSRYQSSSASVDYRVWNLCNVPLPAADCGNGPVVNLPDNVQECTDEEHFNKQYTQNLCLPERGQPHIDIIINSIRCNETFFPIAQYVVNLCSMDANGVTCGLTYSPSTGPEIDSLNSACATSNVSCTTNCRNNITDAKNLRGCCVNWVNTSTYVPVVPALSYSVWKSCEVETPGFCESPLSLSGTTASVMKQNYHIILISTGLINGFMHIIS